MSGSLLRTRSAVCVGCVVMGGCAPHGPDAGSVVPPTVRAAPVPSTEARAAAEPPWASAVREHLNRSPWEALPIRTDRRGSWLGAVAVDDLAAVFEFARKRPLAQHVVGGQRLVFEFQRIRFGGATFYDGAPELTQIVAENVEWAAEGQEGTFNHLEALGYRPLSLVGSLLTYEVRWVCACAGGPPSSSITWVSIDLETGSAPRALDWFEEDSLVSAMKNDVCLGATLTSSQQSNLDAFEDVLRAFERSANPQANCPPTRDAFRKIVLVGYDEKTDLAVVRFGFDYSIGPGHLKTSYFGMHVTPSARSREALRETRAGTGFFAGSQ